MPPTKRLFVADPVCALAFGHNLTLLRWYLDHYRDRFDQVFGVVSRALPTSVDAPASLLRHFTFLYHAEIPLPGSLWANPRGRKLRRIWLRENRALRRFVSRKLHIPVITDPLAGRARADWRRFWRKHAIGPSDTILLPGADYYSTRAILRKLRDLPLSAAPHVHLRFMNVMENAAGQGSVDQIARDILAFGCLGDRLTVSTETEVYARYLSVRLQFPVETTAHPLSPRLEKTAINSPVLTVACLGSGRNDKGFQRLADIVGCCAKINSATPVRFVIQTINPASRDYCAVTHERLASLPRVELLPHSITAPEMNRQYANADVCLLPYCPQTYAMRGSAVVPEAIASGCLLVASSDTGFSSLVETCGGRQARNIVDFAKCIRDFADMAPSARTELAARGYSAYQNIFATSMARLDACLGIKP